MRQAVIIEATGEVENIVVAGPDFEPGPGRVLVPAATAAAIGGTWDGQAFQPPAEPLAQPDPDAELAAAIGQARAAYTAAGDQAGRDAAFLALCDALLGNAGRDGRAAGRPA